MQEICQFVTLQDPTIQNIEICFTLLRICHWKFAEDWLCVFSNWGDKESWIHNWSFIKEELCFL